MNKLNIGIEINRIYLIAPDSSDFFLVTGCRQIHLQRTSSTRQDDNVGINVDGSGRQTVQQKLFLQNSFAVFHQQTLHRDSERLNSLHSRRKEKSSWLSSIIIQYNLKISLELLNHKNRFFSAKLRLIFKFTGEQITPQTSYLFHSMCFTVMHCVSKFH